MFRKKAEKRKDVIKMAKELNLQDVFLNQHMYLKKHFKKFCVCGLCSADAKRMERGFDNYTVILDTDGKQNLIYKHAISTITPLRAVSILDAFDRTDSEDVKE
jgi:host factor-I protein